MEARDSGTLLDMARNAKEQTQQVAIRIPTAWIKDCDEVAKFISRPGFEASRTDVMRAAMARGLQALRDEARAAKTKK